MQIFQVCFVNISKCMARYRKIDLQHYGREFDFACFRLRFSTYKYGSGLKLPVLADMLTI